MPPANQQDDPQLTPTDRKREAVAYVSTEGRPADPEFGGCATAIVVAVIAILVVIGGIAMMIWVNLPSGIVFIAIGVLALAVNPVLWASGVRAKERAEALRDSNP